MSEQRIEMRVISGVYRHRKIHCPLTKDIRPTKDRIKEAIFSAIGTLNNKTFLDLYSGSGAIGIESISRGTYLTIFNDLSKIAIKTIKENIKNLDIKEGFEILNLSDLDAIKFLKESQRKIDVVFLDPPYAKGEYEILINKLYESHILSDDAIIICESNHEIETVPFEYKKQKRYLYGPIIVNIYWR